jgi:hypothetical protein
MSRDDVLGATGRGADTERVGGVGGTSIPAAFFAAGLKNILNLTNKSDSLPNIVFTRTKRSFVEILAMRREGCQSEFDDFENKSNSEQRRTWILCVTLVCQGTLHMNPESVSGFGPLGGNGSH